MINKNTYSLFILKPGFVEFEDRLEEILNENDIKIVVRENGILPLNKMKIHYAEHEGKSFYNTLVAYMTKGEVKGIYNFAPNTVKMVVASTNLNENEEDFIVRSRKLVKEVLRPEMELNRIDFNMLSDEDFKELKTTANGIHASDSGESARREINNLFPNYFEQLNKNSSKDICLE